MILNDKQAGGRARAGGLGRPAVSLGLLGGAENLRETAGQGRANIAQGALGQHRIGE